MTDVALKMDRVFKKFIRGERHDSLRDLIPAMAKRLVGKTSKTELNSSEFWALNDVSYEIRRGEAVGIIGHNGAGKSTMLKHLSGIMKPTTGRIEVNGRLSALIEVGAGFHPDLTGRENVFLNGVILGMTRAEIRRKFDEIVDFAGLGDFIDTPVKRYSSGMHARLGFAVAAHLEPDILVIDEVLSVGDYAFQSKGIAKMKSIAEGGATVIFVSHNLAAVAGLCKRSLLLKNGALLQDGPTPDIIAAYMKQISAVRSISPDKAVVIETIGLHGANGPQLSYRTGEQLEVEVNIRASKPVRDISTVLYMKDKLYNTIFNIAPDRLGSGYLSLEAGETCTYRFKLDLHLAPGAFHVCVALLQRETSNALDVIEPAATFLVEDTVEVGGAANLYPTVTMAKNSAVVSIEAGKKRITSAA
jgi:ABC-type polysaccharide/polyol phosphate transport system ATPase subunit